MWLINGAFIIPRLLFMFEVRCCSGMIKLASKDIETDLSRLIERSNVSSTLGFVRFDGLREKAKNRNYDALLNFKSGWNSFWCFERSIQILSRLCSGKLLILTKFWSRKTKFLFNHLSHEVELIHSSNSFATYALAYWKASCWKIN